METETQRKWGRSVLCDRGNTTLNQSKNLNQQKEGREINIEDRWKNTHQSSLGFDERPVLSIHLIVEAAGVTEVVAVPISPPQRGRGCSTVHTLTTLWEKREKIVYCSCFHKRDKYRFLCVLTPILKQPILMIEIQNFMTYNFACRRPIKFGIWLRHFDYFPFSFFSFFACLCHPLPLSLSDFGGSKFVDRYGTQRPT